MVKQIIHNLIAIIAPITIATGAFGLFAIHCLGIEFSESGSTKVMLFGLALSTYILGVATDKLQAIRELTLVVLQIFLAIIALSSLRLLLNGIFGQIDLSLKGYIYTAIFTAVPIALFYCIYYLRKHLNKHLEPVDGDNVG